MSVHLLAVCDQNRYVLASLYENLSFKSSRLILYEVKGHVLVKLTSIYEHHLNLGMKFASGFLGYFRKRLLWVGLSRSQGLAHIYNFNVEAGELEELVGKRLKLEDGFVLKMARIDGGLYFTLNSGMMTELSIIN